VLDVRDTEWVVRQAGSLGFSLCGVAPAAQFPELERLPDWLARGYAGEMDYLVDPRRTSPLRILEGARSVIVCALNYNTAQPHTSEARASSQGDTPRGWISRYAWGEDYHRVVAERLERLVAAMQEKFPGPFAARAYVDTGPIHERVAAKYAGLGWLAKNTCLIHPELGSWLFLGVIVTTLELTPSLGPGQAPQPDLCGQCTLCIDACPTQALVEPYVLDARRCISYLTIEHRGSVPAKLRPAIGTHVYGCDICQDVCPFNRKAPVTAAEFEPQPAELFAPELEWLASLSTEEYRDVFRGSAMKRAKYQGLVRNACVALGNAAGSLTPGARRRICVLLERLSASGDGVTAEHAAWALARLRAA
jgi:epoxyqueuosine reductase